MILQIYDNTVLKAKNKQGILPVDKDGYRTLPLGALGCFNTRGEWYSSDQEVIQLFDRSSAFMDLVNRGLLLAEDDHPMPSIEEGTVDPRSGAINTPAYITRLRNFAPDKVCAHIKNIRLVSNRDVQSPDVDQNAIIILGDVKPTRARGVFLEQALNNPHQNVCFSIRSLTSAKVIGNVNHKTIVEVMGFDWVPVGGVRAATKANSPTLESALSFTREDMDAITISDDVSLESDRAPIHNLVRHFQRESTPLVRRKSSLERW